MCYNLGVMDVQTNGHQKTIELLCECDSVSCREKVNIPIEHYYQITGATNRPVVAMSLKCQMSPGDELIEETPDYKLAYAGS